MTAKDTDRSFVFWANADLCSARSVAELGREDMSNGMRRRKVVKLAAIGTVFIGGLARRRVFAEAPEGGRTAEEWINEWTSQTKLPVGALHLFRFREPI